MTSAVVILHSERERAEARAILDSAPLGTTVSLKVNKRSVSQNARLWAMLTEVSRQVDWHGVRYSADDWKDYFVHALRRGRWMPSEEGTLVPIGWRTSDLSKQEFSDLMELISEFGARNGVLFGDQQEAA